LIGFLLKSRKEMMSVRDSAIFRWIKKDDVERLSSCVGSLIGIDHKLSPFAPRGDSILRNEPPLIAVAAFCQAVKCFRYLLANGASLSATDSIKTSLATFAVAGGNMEILSILSEQNVSFEGTLFTAAERGNFQAFMWIGMSDYMDLKQRKSDQTSLLYAAVKGGNSQLISYLIDAMKDCLEVKDIFDAMWELEKKESEYEEEDCYSECPEASSW
jgi:hypothetical protein